MTKKKKNLEKTKKNTINIDGNEFVQEFDNLKFIKEYVEWKKNCESISGSDMFVKNVPTLWDFLDTHIFGNIREGSINEGKDGEGATKILDKIESILEDRVITERDVERIEQLHKDLQEMEDNKTDGMALDPKLIVFTEKTYDSAGQVSGERDLRGHYRTKEYVARREKADKGDGLGPAPEGWYSGTGNPPGWALFGGNATYAKPRGLVEILGDIRASFEVKGGASPIPLGVSISIPDSVSIGEFKGKGAYSKLVGIASVEQYFNKAINNEAFWKGGKLLVSKLARDVAAQEFKATKGEQAAIRQATNVDKDKMPAGTIKTFKLKIKGLPIVLFIKAALERANKNKGGDGYRAWTTGGQFDYRKTRREAFGEDAQGNLDNKVISKRLWQQYLWR